MMTTLACALAATLPLLGGSEAPLAAADVLGSWSARVEYAGESRDVALAFEDKGGKILARYSNPSVRISGVPLGFATLEGSSVKIGPLLTLTRDVATGALVGNMPLALVPVHPMVLRFRRTPPGPVPQEGELPGRVAKPVWSTDLHAPLWADLAESGGILYAGAEDGRLSAVEARTGSVLWTFETKGPLRAPAVVSEGRIYVVSDDGFLYALSLDGKELFRTQVTEKPVSRLPIANPESRYDYRGSGVAPHGGRVFLGTHDGRVLALDRASGKTEWEYKVGDAVIGTPGVSSGRVFFGSYDGNVYALDEGTGALAWTYKMGAPVVSTPVVADHKVLIGSRSYDLVALDEGTGKPVWTRYIWFSWVESTAAVRDGIVYVGSSDAAKVFAMDLGTGKPRYDADVQGSAWGRPYVTDARVYVGAIGYKEYMIPHRAAAIALDRKTGSVAWRFPVSPSGDIFGYAGSPVGTGGLVFLGRLDGHVDAFTE
jgi:outer membrane protein assembly factor BamB